MKSYGASFTLELPAYDEFLKESKAIIEMCNAEVGAAPHVATLRDESKEAFTLMSQYSFDELKERWSKFDSRLFDVRSEIMEKNIRVFAMLGIGPLQSIWRQVKQSSVIMNVQ